MGLVDDVSARFKSFPRALLSRLDERMNPPTRVAATVLERQIDGIRAALRAETTRFGADVPRPVRQSVEALVDELQKRKDHARVEFKGVVRQGRVDDFRNFGTGIGVRGLDKRKGRGQWGYQDIPEYESRFILRGSDMAQRAVNKLPEEMFREGYRIRIPDDKDSATAMELSNREMGINESLLTSHKWARSYGGCGLFLGADDGTKDLSQPLREDRIRSFDFVQPFSPLEMVPVTWYADPLRPKFSRPETYRLTPLDRPPGSSPDQYSMPIIHESRVLVFQGIVNWRGQTVYNLHPGWGDSIFVAIKQVLEDFEQAFGGTAILMSDFAVATLKLKNLAELMASGGQDVIARAQTMEDTRSIARVSVVDTEEEYTRESTSVAGLPDLIDRFEGRLASAMDLPVSLMLGQAPAGLNATGDSEIRWWYGTVASKQKSDAQPKIERIVKLRFLAKNSVTKGVLPKGWSIWWPSLWHPSEVEQSTIRLNQSTTDTNNINAQIVTPMEVRKSRFGGEEYSTDTQIDMELTDKLHDEDHEAAALGHGEEEDPNAIVPAGATARPGPTGNPPNEDLRAIRGKTGTPLPKGQKKNQGFPDLTKAKTTRTQPGAPGKRTAPPPGPQVGRRAGAPMRDEADPAPARDKTSLNVSSVAVFNGKGELLIQRRRDNGKWCLPGGHAMPGETAAQAARRELEEETGMKAAALKVLGVMDVHGLKVACFKTQAIGEPSTGRDPDNEAEKFQWVDPKSDLSKIKWANKPDCALQLLGIEQG